MADGDDTVTAVVETPAGDSADMVADSGAPEQTPAEPTSEQRITDLETALAAEKKVSNDYKSQAVGRQSAADRDEAIHARFDTMTALNVRMMEAFALKDTDPDKADQQIEDLNAEYKSQEATQKTTAAWGDTKATYLEDLTGLLEGTGLSGSSPELAATAKAWQTADAAQDRVGMERALRLAERAVAAVARAKAEAPVAKRDAKADLEMANVGKAGAAPESDESIWRAYGRGDLKMSDKVKEAGISLGYL